MQGVKDILLMQGVKDILLMQGVKDIILRMFDYPQFHKHIFSILKTEQ